MNKITITGVVDGSPELVKAVKEKDNLVSFKLNANHVLKFKVGCQGTLAILVKQHVSDNCQVLVVGSILSSENESSKLDGYVLANEIYLVKEGLKLV